MDLLAQSSKVLPQSFPKHGQVVTRIPHFWYQCVLVRVSIPAQTSWPRSKLGRKGFILLTLPHSCSSQKEVRTGTQAGQESGPDAEAMEGCSLLTCFFWLAQLALLLKQYIRIPAHSWKYPQAPPPWSSLIEKMLHSWMSWRHFPSWNSFLCDNFSLCQIDTTISPYTY